MFIHKPGLFGYNLQQNLLSGKKLIFQLHKLSADIRGYFPPTLPTVMRL